MHNMNHFFFNGDSFSKNLIYETLPSHEVPIGGGGFSREEKKDVSAKAGEVLERGKLKVPSWVKKLEPEVALSKDEVRKREKRLDAYAQKHGIPLNFSEKNDFLKKLKKTNPNLDVNNEKDKEFLNNQLYAYLDKEGDRDREKRLAEYLRKNFTLLNFTEQNSLIAAIKQLKPDLDVTKKPDTDFIEQCFSAYIGAEKPITFVAAVENAIRSEQEAQAIASREKRRPPSR